MGTSIQLKSINSTRKVVKIQLSKKNKHYFNAVANLSGQQIKNAVGEESYDNLQVLCKQHGISINSYIESKVIDFIEANRSSLMLGIEGTYRGGKNDFFQSLFPYLEAFSPNFVLSIINKYAPKSNIMLDPFGGLGTSPFIFSLKNTNKAYFCEVNPLMQRIIFLKNQLKKLSLQERERLISDIRNCLVAFHSHIENFSIDTDLIISYKKIFENSEMFSKNTLEQVLKTRSYIDHLYLENQNLACCFEIAALASLIPSSNMQRAGDLRKKTLNELKRISSNLYEHLYQSLLKISEGLLSYEENKNTPILIAEDARTLNNIPSINADIIVTSPPYLNGTNYFRNTKLELWFSRMIFDKNDLGRLRDKAITAGINDVRGYRSSNNPPSLYKSLITCLDKLDKCTYDKRIPQMIKWYAFDIENALTGTLKQLKINGIIAIDIGDSIYCDVHVPTDNLIEEILKKNGCKIIDVIKVRERFSRTGAKLNQVCVIAKKIHNIEDQRPVNTSKWQHNWNLFINELPHKSSPYNSKLWGHPYHSICSYQGKLKPSIAKFITDSFVSKNDKILDLFSGVGTIPFEAALKGVYSYGFDISPAALIISNAKLHRHFRDDVMYLMDILKKHINERTKNISKPLWLPNFNKNIEDYFHPDTFKEILAAREWFLAHKKNGNPTIDLLWACTMHILHGNRPYALSRRSHPITPFSPMGEFIYKSLIEKLENKLNKVLNVDLGEDFVDGTIYNQDATSVWPQEISQLDAIITSPPFYDSTRFYSANWMRLWFAGWEYADFKNEQKRYIEERQKKSFSCYDNVLRQAKERLKTNSPLVMHLGKSNKCNMAEEISKYAQYWFSHHDVFDEKVSDCENYGIKDKGSTDTHQYLILY